MGSGPEGERSLSDWYLSLLAGGVFAPEASLQLSSQQIDYRFETGFLLGGAMGTAIVPGLRGELEVSYLNARPKDSRRFGPNDPRTPVEGRHQELYVLASLWKDFNIDGRIQPYLGGGLGIGSSMLIWKSG